jgi:XTP/dITP diphosphohydrolase
MTPGEGLRHLHDTMMALRGDDGCEWDRQQTHDSLVPYLVEETAELVDAIDLRDRGGIVEELGDVLYQVFFHAGITAEDPINPVTIDDIAWSTAEKMRRRHPHVFAGKAVSGVEEIKKNWDEQKRLEKKRPQAIADQIPRSLDSIARAQALLARAARGGITPGIKPGITPGSDQSPEDLGLALLSLIDTATRNGWSADAALRAAIRQLEEDISSAENHPPEKTDND